MYYVIGGTEVLSGLVQKLRGLAAVHGGVWQTSSVFNSAGTGFWKQRIGRLRRPPRCVVVCSYRRFSTVAMWLGQSLSQQARQLNNVRLSPKLDLHCF